MWDSSGIGVSRRGKGQVDTHVWEGAIDPKTTPKRAFCFSQLDFIASSLVVKHNIQGLSLSGFIAGVGAERPDSVVYQFPN